MFPGVVISAVLMLWMLAAANSGKSNADQSKGSADAPTKIVVGKGGCIIVQGETKKS